MRGPRKTARLDIRLSADSLKQLDRAAEVRQLGTAELVRDLIGAFLGQAAARDPGIQAATAIVVSDAGADDGEYFTPELRR
jgi:hypothetical protein